jgi:hypothetical protein
MRERESAQLTQSIEWDTLTAPVRRLHHNDQGGNPAGSNFVMGLVAQNVRRAMWLAS